MIQMNLLTKQKETHRLKEGTYGCQGEGWGKGYHMIFREGFFDFV